MNKPILLSLSIAVFLSCADEEVAHKKLLFSFDDAGMDGVANTHIEPSNNRIVAVHHSEPMDIVTDGIGNAYLSMGSNAEILVCPMDNLANMKVLFNTGAGVGPLAIDRVNKKIYWITLGGIAYVANLDGSGNPTTLFSGASLTYQCTGLVIDTHLGRLILIDAENKRILIKDLSSNDDPLELVNSGNSPIDKPHDLEISNDGSTIYWADVNKIMQTDLSTGVSTVFRNSTCSHFFVHYPTNHMYISVFGWLAKTEIGGKTTFQKIFEPELELDHFVVQ